MAALRSLSIVHPQQLPIYGLDSANRRVRRTIRVPLSRTERETTMAFAHDTHRAQTEVTLGGWLSTLRADLAERVGKYRLYRATLNELASLSDRDLMDLGLHRGMIDAVAREAAYKA